MDLHFNVLKAGVKMKSKIMFLYMLHVFVYGMRKENFQLSVLLKITRLKKYFHLYYSVIEPYTWN